MVTDPLVPDGDTPLDNMTAPLAPEVPPMAVAKVREPDAAAGLPPDKIETAPPVPVPLPPFTATLPPTPGVVSVVEPAEIDTMPPVPVLPEPTLIWIEPPRPPDAPPDPNFKSPELPDVDVPVLKLK
ncbi:hypothetical protein AeRB84_008389 [Aphanomyces euteiches]|nr:hypothetical protein AeRB84_008389 [Aphanomyces euteiches]